MAFVISLLSIILLNMVLSGNNIMVIGVQAARLPERLRQQAIIWGCLIGLVVQVPLAITTSWLFRIPLLQTLGAAILLSIAYEMLMGSDSGEMATATDTLWGAIRSICLANIVMSLDSVLAIAGAANGDVILVVVGLSLGGILVIAGSQVIAKVIERFPLFPYVGAATLAWTAGQMIAEDPVLIRHLPVIGGVPPLTAGMVVFIFAVWVSAARRIRSARHRRLAKRTHDCVIHMPLKSK